MSDLDAVRETLLENFRTRECAEPTWLETRRKAAMEHFESLGFPHRKQEDWKYTPLKALSEAPFGAPSGTAVVDEGELGELGELGFEDLDAHRIVFVDGFLAPDLSALDGLPDGVTLKPLSEALKHDAEALEPHLDAVSESGRHVFRALNSAFASDGLYLHVPADTKVEKPVHLVFLAADTGDAWVAYPRSLVILERGAVASLVETYHSEAPTAYTTNAMVEIVLRESARLTHVKDQREGDGAFHFGGVKATQEKGSSWIHFSVNLGGRLVRNDVETHLAGEEAHVELDGLSATRGSQHVENHTTIDHAVPRCTSQELYKSILDGKSTGVFRGRVLVREDAQLTDSQQQNKNLLLSSGADINTKPELEIYADDVKAAHGATIGQLDPEHIFFLRSRGIREAEARKILVQAFARDLLNKIELEPVRDGLKQAFSARFGGEG